jgi:hypothetical protein
VRALPLPQVRGAKLGRREYSRGWGILRGAPAPYCEEDVLGDEIMVPRFYRKLGGSHDTAYRFDNSPEAWLWKELQDGRDEACIEAAASIIEVYTEIGSYPSSGEDFHQLAEFMASLRWLAWGGVDELEEFLAANRPEIERRVREIHAQRLEDAE